VDECKPLEGGKPHKMDAGTLRTEGEVDTVLGRGLHSFKLELRSNSRTHS
jgi:hypothetical protein